MSKAWFASAGAKIQDASHNSGTIIQGNFQGSVVQNITNKVYANPEEECKRALFLTNPVDDKSGIETEKETLVPKSCQWIHQQDGFKAWFDHDLDSRLLWISGGLGMGKTMLALFLIQEIEKRYSQHTVENETAIVLYYFVDARNHKRNTSVAVLRGLIWRLIEHRPKLLQLVVEDFQAQREDLFNPTLSSSLEALWRIFTAMLKDDRAGTVPVYCILDGLDELQEDNIRPFVRKITKFFTDEQQHMESYYARRLHPRVVPRFASLRMILLSREAPQCLLDNLRGFPWIQIEKATRRTTKTKTGTKSTATHERKKGVVKLKTVALLALQKKRLADSDGQAVTTVDAAAASGSEKPHRDDEDATQQALEALSIGDSPIQHQAVELSAESNHGPVELSAGTIAHTAAQDAAATTSSRTEEYVFDETVEDSEDEDDLEQQQEASEEEEDGPVRSIALCHYIEAKVEEISQVRSYGEAIETAVVGGLQDNGDGTFLWVDLAIEELRLYEAQHAEQIVKELPPSVNEIYTQALRRIPEHTLPLVAAMFRWVLAAQLPLTIDELATALTQMGFMTANPVEMVRQGVAACSTMLAISEETGEVHTKHTSVADFLTDKTGPLWTDAGLHRYHVNIEDFDGEIAIICLRYLEQGCFNAGPVTAADGDKFTQRVAQFPLLPYATLFWAEHLRSATRPYLDLSSPFFAKKSAIRKNWWLLYYATTTTKHSMLAPRDFTVLHMAAYLNLTFLAQQLEYRGELNIRLNVRDTHGSTPLFWAAVQGNMEMFVFLLQRGASKECVGETIFELACRKGQEDIVEYLLNLGQDVNARVAEQNILTSLGQATRW